MRDPAQRSRLMAAQGLSHERAARLMIALRDGLTPRLFGTKRQAVETYCATHPEYAREAFPLMEVNAAADGATWRATIAAYRVELRTLQAIGGQQ
jgi:hypothetical protein